MKTTTNTTYNELLTKEQNDQINHRLKMKVEECYDEDQKILDEMEREDAIMGD